MDVRDSYSPVLTHMQLFTKQIVLLQVHSYTLQSAMPTDEPGRKKK